MKLWAKRGNWRLWEIREVSIPQIAIEQAEIIRQGRSRFGIPMCYAQLEDGSRIFAPALASNVTVEEEP